MKLVAVTRILNEDDIVEAFVRHHSAELDHHLFLDNGSVDRTLPILAALQAEGLPITVLQCATAFFNEIDVNTNLMIQAVRSFAADWVLFLDADEFVDARATTAGLRAHIAGLPAGRLAFSMKSVPYYDTKMDDPNDLLVPRRQCRRQRVTPDPVEKVCVRGSLAGRVRIDGGQHRVEMASGATLAAPREDSLKLAHYDRRGPWHYTAKNVIGRLKVLAAGEPAMKRNFSAHYISPFEAIRDHAETFLHHPNFLQPDFADLDLVEDPIAYAGGPLRLTEASNGPMKTIRALAHYGELLARHAGRMLDMDAALRTEMNREAATWVRLF
jgi:hypothetical protein